MESQPDELLVDGIHLIAGNDPRKAGWETLKDGSAQLKALAQQMGCVVIAAHQPDRSASKKREVTIPPGLSQIGYGFGIAQSANRIISMSRSSDEEEERLYTVIKIRGGKDFVGFRRLHWDVDVGQIWEKEEEEYDF